jgi:hypothetical protein
LAVADGAALKTPARGVQTFTFTDATRQHTYRLVATPGPTAGAPARLESFVDGEKRIQTDFVWTREAGGWRARSAHITGYYHGAPLAEADVTTTSGEVAAASWNLPRGGAALGGLLLPTELQAETACVKQYLGLAAADAAWGLATAALIANVNPLTVLAYWGSAAWVGQAELDLYDCQTRACNVSVP